VSGVALGYEPAAQTACGLAIVVAFMSVASAGLQVKANIRWQNSWISGSDRSYMVLAGSAIDRITCVCAISALGIALDVASPGPQPVIRRAAGWPLQKRERYLKDRHWLRFGLRLPPLTACFCSQA
jgi:hypothetical protein